MAAAGTLMRCGIRRARCGDLAALGASATGVCAGEQRGAPAAGGGRGFEAIRLCGGREAGAVGAQGPPGVALGAATRCQFSGNCVVQLYGSIDAICSNYICNSSNYTLNMLLL